MSLSLVHRSLFEQGIFRVQFISLYHSSVPTPLAKHMWGLGEQQQHYTDARLALSLFVYVLNNM